jgi:hypothetical protein
VWGEIVGCFGGSFLVGLYCLYTVFVTLESVLF